MNTENTAEEGLRAYANLLEQPFNPEAAFVARQALAGLEGARHRRRPVIRRTVRVASLVAVAVFGFASLAVAADGAVPGDLLYPVDLAVENLVDQVSGEHPQARARERAAESRQLAAEGDGTTAITALVAALGHLEGLPDAQAAEFLTDVEELAILALESDQVGARSMSPQASMMARDILSILTQELSTHDKATQLGDLIRDEAPARGRTGPQSSRP